MIWMMTATATAGILLALEPEVPVVDLDLPPLERRWGGDRACDVREALAAAGEGRSKRVDLADPQQTVADNLHVLDAWEGVRDCATVERELDGTFDLYFSGQVLIAAARVRTDTMPGVAANHALDAFALGNDSKAGPMVSAMVGQVLHLEALNALEAIWPALSEGQRVRVATRLAELHAADPGVDLEAERAVLAQIADAFWPVDAVCVQAHEEVMVHVERALAAKDIGLLDANRAQTWAGWLTPCAHGIESVMVDYLEQQAEIDGSVAAFGP